MDARYENAEKFYIDGKWREPDEFVLQPVINPATEEAICHVALGTKADVDHAVAAATKAFKDFSQTTVEKRLEYLNAILKGLIERQDEIAEAIHKEMGAPKFLSKHAQAKAGIGHFSEAIKALQNYKMEELKGTTLIRKEPIGVCALISPWNWPMNQIACKVAPAIAAGCTMVLKPSEVAPLDAIILAEIIDAAGLPSGVFNLVQGCGPDVGAALCAHPNVDMISFTGSTRAGINISELASKDIKRVCLELGGKSADIIMPDANFSEAITSSVTTMMVNSGQSCNARSRLLVPESDYEDAVLIAVDAAEKIKILDKDSEEMGIGPLANETQYLRVLDMIHTGLNEGATLLTGGVHKPDDKKVGYYIKPTIFGNVVPGMTIEKEEIFGPVLCLIPYKSIDQAIEIANDSEYGLSGSVWSNNVDEAINVASQIHTGMVHINGAPSDLSAPFGGYKKSGNGREWGRHGLEEFLEIKAVFGAVVSK